MSEFELKFQVPPERAAAVEAALGGDAERTHLRARYFDTADGALARAGLVLRIRQEDEARVQTAKGRAPGGFERLEHEVTLPAGSTDDTPRVGRHAGHPLHDRLLDALRDCPADLECRFETDVVRLARTVQADDAAVEIALDRGAVRAGQRSHPVLEVEFERKAGSAGAAIALARDWCARHGLWLDPQSKSALGRRLARGATTVDAVHAQPPRKGGRHLLARAFDDMLAQVLDNARELAAGTGSDDHVHQLRVGLRRVRGAWRELASACAPATLAPATQDALHALFRLLGTHRDGATLVPSLLRQVAATGGPAPAWQPALPDVGAAVRAAAVQDAFLDLVALARDLHEGEGLAPKALRALAGERLERLHRHLAKAGRQFGELPAERRHKVRKRAKRLRYLAECVRPLYDADAVDAYVRSLEDLQDALGHYQDAAAGRTLFEEHAQDDPSAWFGAGWLAAREEQLAAACERACRRTAHRAKPFWN